MGKAKKQRVEVTEIFVAKACPSMVYWGIITRSVDDNGTPVLFSRILMEEDGLLCAQASDQKTLAQNLNFMAKIHVFGGLHDNHGITNEIFGSDFFLN
jgi:hypothetical protein